MKFNGIGIDIEKWAKFEFVKEDLIERFLSNKEYIQFNSLSDIEAKSKFLAKHWTVKEALVKSIDNLELSFNLIEITKSNSGKPQVKILTDDTYQFELSLSYGEDYIVASVVSFLKQIEIEPQWVE